MILLMFGIRFFSVSYATYACFLHRKKNNFLVMATYGYLWLLMATYVYLFFIENSIIYKFDKYIL